MVHMDRKLLAYRSIFHCLEDHNVVRCMAIRMGYNRVDHHRWYNLEVHTVHNRVVRMEHDMAARMDHDMAVRMDYSSFC